MKEALGLALLLAATGASAQRVRGRVTNSSGLTHSQAAAGTVGVPLAATPLVMTPGALLQPRPLEATMRPTVADGVMVPAAAFATPGGAAAAPGALTQIAAPAPRPVAELNGPAAPTGQEPVMMPAPPLAAPIVRTGDAASLRHFSVPAESRDQRGDRPALGTLYGGESNAGRPEDATAVHDRVMQGAAGIWGRAMDEAGVVTNAPGRAAVFAAAADRLLGSAPAPERLAFLERAAMAAEYVTDFPVPATMRGSLPDVSAYALERLAALGTPEALALVALQAGSDMRLSRGDRSLGAAARRLMRAQSPAKRRAALALARSRVASDPGFEPERARLNAVLDAL